MSEETLTWTQALNIEEDMNDEGCRVRAHHDIEGFAWVSGSDREGNPIRFDTLPQYERWLEAEARG